MTTPTPIVDDRAHLEALDRRAALRKLAVGGAVVWSAPLIAKTAHAASATSCTSNVLDWNDFTADTEFTDATVGGVTVTLEPSTFFGGTTALGTNRNIRTGPQGGVAGQALRFEQTPIEDGGQVITLSFSQTVFTVSFTITDIDNSIGGGWSDRIEVISPTNYTFTVPPQSDDDIPTSTTDTNTVIGDGTAGDRFRNSNNNYNYLNQYDNGNVTLTFPGPLTQIQIHFLCAATDGGGNQLINVLPLGFCS